MGVKKKVLIQLDTDARPSVFDAIVAVDSGAEVLLPHANVRPEDVRDLVHGAMFTRGGGDLASTAVFVGGSDVSLGESVLASVRDTFFGPFRVSALLDSSGANTTASGAVLAAVRSLRELGQEFAGTPAIVLGSTGPVGRRVARLLARAGAKVTCGSRSAERAEEVACVVREAVEGSEVDAAETSSTDALDRALEGKALVIAAGGPGVQLVPKSSRERSEAMRVAIDLNAVPPEGIEGIEGPDVAVERGGVVCWGAIGVGGIKMKVHRASIALLFERNDALLDADEVFDLGRRVVLGES